MGEWGRNFDDAMILYDFVSFFVCQKLELGVVCIFAACVGWG
jgi:hypothetical protein